MLSKCTIVTAVMAVLVSTPAYAGEPSITAKQDCIDATSDYERYELGCSIDVTGSAISVSTGHVVTALPGDPKQ